MRYATLPSTSASARPVTVTVCAWFQLAGVKVKVAVDTVPSDGSELFTGIVTSLAGWDERTTVNVAVKPVSVVCKAPAVVTTKSVCRLPKSMSRWLGSLNGRV
jgi:hypothetical protein